MTRESEILELAMSKKRIIVNGIFPSNTVFIIDFYNCYCSMIRFCKFKTFSLETFLVCMERILSLVKNRKTVIISKNIFEVEPRVIRELLLLRPNISYFIVEDACEIKSINRERDDYFCLAYQAACREKSVIITNDKFSNFDTLVKETRPFKVINVTSPRNDLSFTQAVIDRYQSILTIPNVRRASFSFSSNHI